VIAGLSNYFLLAESESTKCHIQTDMLHQLFIYNCDSTTALHFALMALACPQ
jgi:hypothetical protein